MHGKTDHLNFSLKLDFTSNGVSILKSFYSYNCPILEIPFVNIPKPALSNQVLAAEIVCGNLKFFEMKPL